MRVSHSREAQSWRRIGRMSWRSWMAGGRIVLAVVAGCAGCSRAHPGAGAARPLVPVTGRELAHAVRESGAGPVLVNLWATWCVPCREEMPSLVRLQRRYAGRGLKVLLVSWDSDPKVAQQFLAAQGVDFPSYWKSGGERDPAFIEGFEPRWSGAFPSTFIYDGAGRLLAGLEGKQSYEAFEQKVLEVLNSKGS